MEFKTICVIKHHILKFFTRVKILAILSCVGAKLKLRFEIERSEAHHLKTPDFLVAVPSATWSYPFLTLFAANIEEENVTSARPWHILGVVRPLLLPQKARHGLMRSISLLKGGKETAYYWYQVVLGKLTSLMFILPLFGEEYNIPFSWDKSPWKKDQHTSGLRLAKLLKDLGINI